MKKQIDWLQKVQKAIHDEFGIRKDMVTPTASLADDLHLDEDNRMDLLMMIDGTLDERDAYDLKTVAELVAYLETHRPNGIHTHPTAR